ncbi:MAG: hypothetical protein DRI32_09370 [Chloroflexi bacterium]|nr:MAG: hypothetical protein DRI32_09370 [Chloroflexota bacterium]
MITSEFKEQEIMLYSSSGEMNDSPVPYSGAGLWIWDGSRVFTFLQSDTPGLYKSEPFAATVSSGYWLLLKAGTHVDTAFAVAAPVSPFKRDTIKRKDNLYKFIYGGSDLPAITDVYFDWSSDPAYCNVYGSCYAKSTYYTLQTIDVVEEFAPDKQEILFPTGTVIIRKKYSLSPAHQAFIRSLLIETEWRGGLFDTEQGNVPTNFFGNTKGWFGVCMVINDTAVVR